MPWLVSLNAISSKASPLISKVLVIWCHGMYKPIFGKSSKSDDFFRYGILYIKGGELKDELNQLKYRSNVYPISQFFKESFFDTKNVIHIY